MRKSTLSDIPDIELTVASALGSPNSHEKNSPLKLVRQVPRRRRQTVNEPEYASDEVLRTMVDACASNVAVLDESGNVMYASKAWQAFEKANDLAVGFGPSSYFEACTRMPDQTPEGKVSLKDDISQLRLGGEKEFYRSYSFQGHTTPVILSVRAARLELADSGFRILTTHKGVSARAPIEDPKRTAERLSQLLEKTKTVVWEADVEPWQLTYVSEQAGKMFGYPLTQWYQTDFLATHIHPDDERRAFHFFLKKYETAEQYDFTFRLLAKNGRVVWVHNLVSVISENGQAKSLRGFMIDVTEQKCAEETMRELGGRLIAAQEEERSRVARELHDDLNQRMALLSIELEQLGQEVQKPQTLRRRCRELQTQAQEISTDLHQLSYKLHPSKLDHLGLGAAVKSLCEELSKNGRLKVEVCEKGFPATLPGDVTLCVFRIAQESLRNCLRHSEAQSVQVVLEKTSWSINLSVSDNGRGFDPESPLLKKGLGFISMRERVRLIGGEIHIYSQPQRGTRIEVSVPLPRDRRSATRSRELGKENGGWLSV